MSVSESLTLHVHEAVHSEFLPDDRTITVFVPPGYDGDADRRYPVLYMHDGQNLFQPERSFKTGEYWRVGETATALIEARIIQPLIIVGVDNVGPQRIHEYTPTVDRRRGGGGADAYGRFLIEELKPFVDATYRTMPDAMHTGVAGSSLGGLVSLYLALTHPDVFGRAAIMSPSVWWDRRAILRNVRDAKPKPRLRLWVDIGTREGLNHVGNTRLLKQGLVQAGWIEGDDLHYEEIDGGTHSEADWAARFDRVLTFLWNGSPIV
jgi:predicted alpha/beta superfamily hydrolase